MAANTSTKVATLTGAAKDDVFASLTTGLTEDNRVANLNVLSNDPGAARLYSLAQNVSGFSAAAFPVSTTATSALGAALSINPDGTIRYDASAVDVQFLGANDKLADTFSYTVRMANGAVSTATVSVEFQGRNDGPVITNATAAALGSVTEDLTLSASGQLSASDADQGATQAWSIVGDAAGAYGVLAIEAATGNWTYSLDNAAHQALAAGESHSETFTVRVSDDQGAYVDQEVSVLVSGSNDIAAFSGTASGDIAEDGVPSVGGTLVVSDVDQGEAHTQAIDALAGAYGAFSVDTDGQWSYVLGAAAQTLTAGEAATEQFTVASMDGSASRQVVVTVIGTNDAPLLVATSPSAQLKEATASDAGVATAHVSLLRSDIDSANTYDLTGWTQVGNTASYTQSGIYGNAVLDTVADTLTYALDNGRAATDALTAADNKFEDFSVRIVDSADPAASCAVNVQFAVAGADDAKGKVLFVDDDGGMTTSNTWLSVLDQLGYSVTHESIPVNGNPVGNLGDFDVVIWSVSDRAYGNLTAQNVSTLTNYLNSGGSLLYAGGHDLYYEPEATAFINNYLGLSDYAYNMPYVSSEAHFHASGPGGSYTLSDLSDSVGITSYYQGTMMSAFQTRLPSARMLMEIASGGAHAGHYGYASYNSAYNDIAAINITGGYRAATWGFDLNQLDAAYRADFLDDTIKLLGGADWNSVWAM